jgi:hypothetical protein
MGGLLSVVSGFASMLIGAAGVVVASGSVPLLVFWLEQATTRLNKNTEQNVFVGVINVILAAHYIRGSS